MPLQVNSGYRSLEHNKRVGGSKTSQHLDMEAADITCANNARLLDEIEKQGILLGQVIVYHNGRKRNGIQFIHVALPCDRHPNFELSYKEVKL